MRGRDPLNPGIHHIRIRDHARIQRIPDLGRIQRIRGHHIQRIRDHRIQRTRRLGRQRIRESGHSPIRNHLTTKMLELSANSESEENIFKCAVAHHIRRIQGWSTQPRIRIHL